ncbi:hypothetical protein [Nostoc sp.]|uniref:hypothetical protein n=1 Tax=Nostoc sp. TaxID=1180 RepID=UPI002FFD4461
MKDAWDWEEEDIELLIQNWVQESLTLNYKRCESLDKRNPDRKILVRHSKLTITTQLHRHKPNNKSK